MLSSCVVCDTATKRRCRCTTPYCSKVCQLADWKRGHAKICGTAERDETSLSAEPTRPQPRGQSAPPKDARVVTDAALARDGAEEEACRDPCPICLEKRPLKETSFPSVPHEGCFTIS